MDISNFDYFLPKSFIAQFPADPRDSSKLLVIDRKNGNISHHIFHEITDYVTKDDVLVFNNTKVFPARLIGAKPIRLRSGGGKVEILLLKNIGGARWEAITKPGLRIGSKILFEGFFAQVLEHAEQTVKI